jgi:hypothetical protein
MAPSKKLSRFTAGLIAFSLPLILIAPSQPAFAQGVNDVTSSIRFGSDGRVIGSMVPEVSDHDDTSTLLSAPWPMNFFGRKYTGLCVTSNGTISPVVFENSPSCDNSYDQTLARLADSADAPLIAAFANDNHTNRPIREREYRIVSMIRDSQTETITVTTSADHSVQNGSTITRSIYVASELFENGNSDDYRTDEYWFENVSLTSSGPRTFTFSGTTAKRMGASGTYTPTYSAATNSSVPISSGWIWDQSSADLDGVDDGKGLVGSIYVGETTIDGRDAWVYTNYRTSNFENKNPQIFQNTFQIVLIKRATPGGSSSGFDFDIEYNYGTVTDGEDGYDAPNQSCSGLKPGCRTGVGLADWDPISQTADVYELFPNTPSRDLVDRLITGMTNNRLNSTINGRYTFAKVGGSVQSFATPTMDGTGLTVSRPIIASPTDPVPSQAVLSAGSSALLEDGQPVSVSLVRNSEGNGLIMTSGSFMVTLAAQSNSQTPLVLDSNGNLILDQGGLVAASGSGFAANSPVKIFMFSSPVNLGTLFTNGSGVFSGTLSIPAGLSAGPHNIQLIGYDAANKVKVLTLGVVVRDPNPVAVATPAASVASTATPVALARTGFDSSGYLTLILLFVGAGLIMSLSSRGKLVEEGSEDELSFVDPNRIP